MSDELEKARAIILAEKQARASACWVEVQAVLEKHRCNLEAVPQFVGTAGVYSVIVQIRVSARED